MRTQLCRLPKTAKAQVRRTRYNPDAAQARAETEQQMKDLKTALLALLDQSGASSLH